MKILLGFLIVLFLSSCVTYKVPFNRDSYNRTDEQHKSYPLNMKFEVYIYTYKSDILKEENRELYKHIVCNPICAIQVITRNMDLEIKYDRVSNSKGTFYVAAPQSFRSVERPLKSEEEVIKLKFPNHTTIESAKALNSDDSGTWILSYVQEGGDYRTASRGIMVFYLYNTEASNYTSISMKIDDKEIPTGTCVETGNFITAKKISAIAGFDNLSFCVRAPNNDLNCASDMDPEVSVKIKDEGEYVFRAYGPDHTYAESKIIGRKECK